MSEETDYLYDVEPGVPKNTLVHKASSIKIDNAEYPALVILEAAFSWIGHADRHNWLIHDLNGIAIDKRAFLESKLTLLEGK